MRAAQTLGSFDFSEPEVEVAVAEDELDLSNFVMEEDAELCAAAGIPVSAPSTLPILWTFSKGSSQPSLLYLDCKLPM